MRGSFHVVSRTAIGIAATESSDTLCRVAGTGALEKVQQETSGAATTLAVLSSVFIWSQMDCVWGVEHSAILDEKIAHADSGAGPNPATLSANAKMSNRRTTPQFTKKRRFQILSSKSPSLSPQAP